MFTAIGNLDDPKQKNSLSLILPTKCTKYGGTQRYSGNTTLYITDLWETVQTDSAEEKKLKVQQKQLKKHERHIPLFIFFFALQTIIILDASFVLRKSLNQKQDE